MRRGFKEHSNELIKEGYKKNLHGMAVGFATPDLVINKEATVLIQPVKSTAKHQPTHLLEHRINNDVEAYLKDTSVFSLVTEDMKKPYNYSIEIVIDDYFRETCIWSLNVRDRAGHLVASGSDMLSSSGRKAAGVFLTAFTAFPHGEDYFSKEIMDKMFFFISSFNPEFKEEQDKRLKQRQFRRKSSR